MMNLIYSKALRRILIDEPYEVLWAPSGQEGLELLAQQGDVSIVFSDQRMPEMTGVEFLGKVRQLYPETLRVLLTGYADAAAAMDSVNMAGASRYLTKALDDGELCQILAELTTRSRLERENRVLQAAIQEKNKQLAEWRRPVARYRENRRSGT